MCCLVLFHMDYRTPRYPDLYSQTCVSVLPPGRDEKAKSTFIYLHGRDFDADSEIEKIRDTLSNNISWIESIRALKEWNVLKPILIMVVLHF